jgi:hypothetical protein
MKRGYTGLVQRPPQRIADRVQRDNLVLLSVVAGAWALVLWLSFAVAG